MGLKENRRAASAEVLKIAAAVLLALVIFSVFLNFALGPKEAEQEAGEIRADLLHYSENASLEILAYNET